MSEKQETLLKRELKHKKYIAEKIKILLPLSRTRITNRVLNNNLVGMFIKELKSEFDNKFEQDDETILSFLRGKSGVYQIFKARYNAELVRFRRQEKEWDNSNVTHKLNQHFRDEILKLKKENEALDKRLTRLEIARSFR